MEKTERFYDLGLKLNTNLDVMRSMLNELIELGYKTVALEQIYDHSVKHTAKKGTEIFPEPAPEVALLQKEFDSKKIRILSRLTIIYNDVIVAHSMTRSRNLKRFNLIAGLPKTDAALTHCCTTFNGDLVSFDPTLGPKLLVNRKAFQVAIRRGMYFEIKYAPAIRDSNQRKDLIKIAHTYMNRGKSCNVIFSSGAETAFELRGPYDVANLAYIFGLSQSQGMNAVDRSCRQVFLMAEGRRHGKTNMIVKATGPVCFDDAKELAESAISDEEDDDDEDGDDDDDDDDLEDNVNDNCMPEKDQLEGDKKNEKKCLTASDCESENMPVKKMKLF